MVVAVVMERSWLFCVILYLALVSITLCRSYDLVEKDTKSDDSTHLLLKAERQVGAPISFLAESSLGPKNGAEQEGIRKKRSPFHRGYEHGRRYPSDLSKHLEKAREDMQTYVKRAKAAKLKWIQDRKDIFDFGDGDDEVESDDETTTHKGDKEHKVKGRNKGQRNKKTNGDDVESDDETTTHKGDKEHKMKSRNKGQRNKKTNGDEAESDDETTTHNGDKEHKVKGRNKGQRNKKTNDDDDDEVESDDETTKHKGDKEHKIKGRNKGQRNKKTNGDEGESDDETTTHKRDKDHKMKGRNKGQRNKKTNGDEVGSDDETTAHKGDKQQKKKGRSKGQRNKKINGDKKTKGNKRKRNPEKRRLAARELPPSSEGISTPDKSKKKFKTLKLQKRLLSQTTHSSNHGSSKDAKILKKPRRNFDEVQDF